MPAKGTSQGRGNSGVFLMDRYELQVLDSYENKTYFDGQASAIYKQTPPMVNAMRPPGEWNTYDIVWNAPKFKDDGSLESPAYITVLHNGVLTLNHFALEGVTPFTEVAALRKARQSCRSTCRTTATRCGTATSGCARSSRSSACASASRIITITRRAKTRRSRICRRRARSHSWLNSPQRHEDHALEEERD